MKNPTHEEATLRFLQAMTKPWMANRYNSEMELQINVAKGKGKEVTSELVTDDGVVRYTEYVDDASGDRWKTVRIPRDAKTDNPKWESKPLTFDLTVHADAIGSTGWNWVQRKSIYVGFDIDSISGHKAGLSHEKLDLVLEKLIEIPWVTVYRSTSGNGYHAYVDFEEGVATNNHTEHAALAKAVLDKMSAVTGYNFDSAVDVVGNILWLWGKKYCDKSFEIIKQGTLLPIAALPVDWKSYVTAVSKRTNRPKFEVFDEEGHVIQDLSGDTAFEDMVIKQNRVKLDREHEALIHWLDDHGCDWSWDSSRNTLKTHTLHLKAAHSDPELNIKGVFDTNSSRSTPINCFCFPHPNGVWELRRFGQNVNEVSTWETDSGGWTRCYFNRLPDLKTVCKMYHGAAHPSGGYQFQTMSQASMALDALNVKVSVPESIKTRSVIIKSNDRTGNIEVITPGLKDEMLQGWARHKNNLVFVAEDVKLNKNATSSDGTDDRVMYTVTGGGFYAWAIVDHGVPIIVTKDDVKSWLHHQLGITSGSEVQNILGKCISRPWETVNEPFKPEFLSGRRWNKGAARLKFEPSNKDFEMLQFPTWERIMQHIGSGLDDAVKDESTLAGKWCVEHGITTGLKYLTLWIASMFQHPFEQLPLLFLHSSQQNTGKSTLHDALSLLLENGVSNAESALNSQAGFNKELMGRLLVYVEETDFSKKREVYNKLKDWITGKEIMIHEKGKTPIMVKNSTHWIVCTNNYRSIPIEGEDTRVTMVHVEPIPFMDLIPRAELTRRLIAEASDFLAFVLQVEVPPTNDRLRIPALRTADKTQLETVNSNILMRFVNTRCVYEPGEYITYKVFTEMFFKFIDELSPTERNDWDRRKVQALMPPEYPFGRSTKLDSAFAFGNIRLRTPADDDPVGSALLSTKKKKPKLSLVINNKGEGWLRGIEE